MASFQAPPESSPASLIPWLEEGGQGSAIPLKGPLPLSLLTASQSSQEPVINVVGREYALGRSVTPSGKIVVAALPMPQGLSQPAMRIRSGSATYWELFRKRNQIRTTFFLTLVVITVLVFFLSVWMAQFLIQADHPPGGGVGRGHGRDCYRQVRPPRGAAATGEMGELVRAFNHMAADLDASRQLAESSSAQLTAANLAIEERRRELETIVETIPSGVVTLDGAGTVLQSNRAFAALLGRRVDFGLGGERLNTLFPAECADDLAGVMRRGRRMGAGLHGD
jgi:two-component system nitrogen regulation sensor histidine kinase NtrY